MYASSPHVVVGDFSLHFVAGLGRASVGGWYQGPLGLYPICAAGPFHLKKLKMDKIQIIFSNFLSILPF